jgi:rhamnulose-1-phosphate aldolase
MSPLSELYTEISEVAELLHQKGWAEKNAGNFSIRVDQTIELQFSNKEIILLKSYPLLADSVFLVTGKGKRMRDIAKSPYENTIIIKINSAGDSYSIIDDKQITPTSELPTHLAIHNMITERGSKERAVIHSHVTELIALSHIKEYCNQDSLNTLLWSMHPETIMFIPDGLGFVPFCLPGSVEIAGTTVEAFRNHAIVLWEKHGVFSIAHNLNDSYDLIEIAAKSAEIYFMCAAASTLPQGLSPNQLDQMKEIEF